MGFPFAKINMPFEKLPHLAHVKHVGNLKPIMPNGGSDCCGTCCFNKKNKGQTGYEHSKDVGDNYCLIRDVKIDNAFWTYCTNHPHHNPQKIKFPIGPLFRCTESSIGRSIWHPSPDTEDIRLGLLGLLKSMEEQPQSEYPFGFYLDEMVVLQLGEFREKRAVSDLERIARFDPKKTTGKPFERTREKLVVLAQVALGKING